MTKSLGEQAYTLYANTIYANANSDSLYGVKPWIEASQAAKDAWEYMAERLADRVISDWGEADQWCSSEDLNSETIRDGEFGAPQLTLYSDDGKKAYRYRLVETLTAATHDKE